MLLCVAFGQRAIFFGIIKLKTYKHLFERVCSFENLYIAYLRASKGKRFKPDVDRFNYNLEHELIQTEKELLDGSYQPGVYHQFLIHEPKECLISAAPFRDRVVHHAIHQVIEPIFDRRFIYDSYACRLGKGTHSAVRRFKEFLRYNSYVLKCDIQKYFPSIDHEILLSLIHKRIKDEKLMDLIVKIVSNRPPDPLSDVPQWFSSDDLFSTLNRPRGIPIGNLTSQFFANIYLHELDAFVKYELHEKYYIRYVDDLVILGNDKKHLHKVKEQIRDFLQGLRLRLHPKKSNVFPVRVGTDFLGYRIYPDHSRIRKENVKRFITRTKRLQLDYSCGKITLDKVRSSIHSWLGHAKHADSYKLRRKLLGSFHFMRKNVHVY